MNDPIEHHIPTGIEDPVANYSLISVIAHWTGAIAVIFLFLTHEDEWLTYHVSVGMLLAVPLLARVIYRWSKGFPRSVDQHPALNFLSRLVMIGMLLVVLVTAVTGALLPLFAGEPYTFFALGNWAAPYNGNQLIHALLEETHDAAGHVIIPLFALHLLGFAKHMIFGKGGNRMRMLRPKRGGR